jgi:transcriptional regulator with XRE-family HTH domain
MNKQTILNYIANTNIPTLDKAKKIADYFAVSLDYLVSPSYGDSGISLYHYTTANGLIGILETMQLHYSSFLKTNDPKERVIYKYFQNEEGVSDEQAKEKLKKEGYDKFIAFCKQPQSETDTYRLEKTSHP